MSAWLPLLTNTVMPPSLPHGMTTSWMGVVLLQHSVNVLQPQGVSNTVMLPRVLVVLLPHSQPHTRWQTGWQHLPLCSSHASTGQYVTGACSSYTAEKYCSGDVMVL
jgi:hypothetical protein